MSGEPSNHGMAPGETAGAMDSGVKIWTPPAQDSPSGLIMPSARPFPAESLPDAARRMVAEVSRVTFADPNLAFAQIIPWMAAALGKGAMADSGDRRNFGNVFVLGIAESGTGKSESLRILRRPFDAIYAEVTDVWERTVRSEAETQMKNIQLQMDAIDKRSRKNGYSEADAQEVAGLSADKRQLERKLIPPRLLFEDATQEAMVDACASFDQSMMACSSDAGKAISNLHGRYAKPGAGLIREDTLFLKGYSNEQIVVDRIKRSTLIQEPCLTLLWLVQPCKVALLYGDESLRDGGLIPRMMPCLGPVGLPSKTFQNPIRDDVLEGWQNLINGLYDMRQKGGALHSHDRVIFPVERSAMDFLIGWDNRNREKTRGGELSDISAFVSRWGEWALRIVVSLQAAEYITDQRHKTISVEMIQRAIAIAEWFANEQLRVLYDGRTAVRASEVAKQAERANKLETLLSASGGEKSLSELENRNSFSRDEVERLVRVAPNRFAIEVRLSATKPAHVCVLKTSRRL